MGATELASIIERDGSLICYLQEYKTMQEETPRGTFACYIMHLLRQLIELVHNRFVVRAAQYSSISR